MFEYDSGKTFLRKMLPRIAKAVVIGLFYFILLYVVPMFLISQASELALGLFSGYGQLVTLFAEVVIFFAVASQLTAGTIFQHALNVGKALILIIFFVVALDGGIIKMDLNIVEGAPISIIADLRVYLMMLIAIDLVGLAKSLLQALNFLSERAEKELPQPQPAE